TKLVQAKVRGDSIKERGEASRRLVTLASSVELQERRLRNFLGSIARAEKAIGELDERTTVFVEQHPERVHIAVPHPFQRQHVWVCAPGGGTTLRFHSLEPARRADEGGYRFASRS